MVPASVSVGPTTGIIYVVEPASFGDGSADVEVTVTATVHDGFGWGTIVAPWVRVDADTAEWTATLALASCDEVTPVAPSVVEAVCVNGVVTAPTLTLAGRRRGSPTPLIDEPPYEQGQSVTVTATLDPAGVGWPADLGDWVRVSATVATLSVEFDAVACTPVALAAPTVGQATCTAGVVRAGVGVGGADDGDHLCRRAGEFR